MEMQACFGGGITDTSIQPTDNAIRRSQACFGGGALPTRLLDCVAKSWPDPVFQP